MFLTDEELVELTGYKAAKHQVEWLKARGWKHELNRLGRPRVLRAYAEHRMGLRAAPTSAVTTPNWGAPVGRAS